MTNTSRKGKKNEVDEEAFNKLFSHETNNCKQFSALWFSRDGNIGMYYFGYKNATEILLKWFSKPNDDNGTIYPLMFLLRHTVEIGLKESIRRAILLGSTKFTLSERERERIWATHNLQILADLFNKVMEEYDVNEDDDWKEIKPYLQLWQAADPQATLGKYPVSTNGEPFNVTGVICGEKLVIIGMKTIDFLDSVLSTLEYYLSIER